MMTRSGPYKGRNSRTVSIRFSLDEYANLEQKALLARRGESVGLYCKRKLIGEALRQHHKGASPA